MPLISGPLHPLSLQTRMFQRSVLIRRGSGASHRHWPRRSFWGPVIGDDGVEPISLKSGRGLRISEPPPDLCDLKSKVATFGVKKSKSQLLDFRITQRAFEKAEEAEGGLGAPSCVAPSREADAAPRQPQLATGSGEESLPIAATMRCASQWSIYRFGWILENSHPGKLAAAQGPNAQPRQRTSLARPDTAVRVPCCTWSKPRRGSWGSRKC